MAEIGFIGEFEKVKRRVLSGSVFFGSTLKIFTELGDAHNADMQAVQNKLNETIAGYDKTIEITLDRKNAEIEKLEAEMQADGKVSAEMIELQRSRIAVLEKDLSQAKANDETNAKLLDIVQRRMEKMQESLTWHADYSTKSDKRIAELEAQVPKVVKAQRKKKIITEFGSTIEPSFCTGCGGFVAQLGNKFCPHCGAKLDWSV